MIKSLISVIFLLVSIIHTVHAVEIKHFENNECTYIINLNGTIKVGDAKSFDNFINYYRKRFSDGSCNRNLYPKDFKFFSTIYVDSNGGDVAEAMKIGYIIRENKFHVMVGNKKQCLSSCVFILASGVRRDSAGRVGIHKPYFSDLNEKMNVVEIRKIREENLNKIKEYLKFMDISESMLDAMLSVEPNKMKILSDKELEHFRLSIPDANYEEKSIAKDAHEFNLTSAEYRKRSAVVETKCGNIASKLNDIQNFFKCQHTTLLEISEQEFDRRKAKAFQECGPIKNNEEKRKDCFFKINILNK